MKAIPARTSFPPVIHQTTKAIMPAGKTKNITFAMKIMTNMPIIKNRNRTRSPVTPYEPISNSDSIIKRYRFFRNKMFLAS